MNTTLSIELPRSVEGPYLKKQCPDLNYSGTECNPESDPHTGHSQWRCDGLLTIQTRVPLWACKTSFGAVVSDFNNQDGILDWGSVYLDHCRYSEKQNKKTYQIALDCFVPLALVRMFLAILLPKHN